MIYKQFQDKHLSMLGFGTMRFPLLPDGVTIDEQQVAEMTAYAIEHGINYFDTAYIYAGNEAAFGEILEKTGLRNRVNIATKLPHYLIRSREGMEKLFQEELRRLRTDHVDYYLMHMLTDVKTWDRLKELGIESQDNVAFLTERSELYMFSILGVLSAGAVYVPLDDAHPDERIKFILNDTQSKVVIVSDETYESYVKQLCPKDG